MTDENKPRQTLKLNLSNVNIGHDNVIKKALGPSKTGTAKTVMVEVKKQRSFGKKTDSSESKSLNPELDAKVNILKQAALKQDTGQESALIKIRNQEIAKYKEEQSLSKLSEEKKDILDDDYEQTSEFTESQDISSLEKRENQKFYQQKTPKATTDIKSKDVDIEEIEKKSSLKISREDLKAKTQEITHSRGKKIDIRYISDNEDDEQPTRTRSLASIRRAKEKKAKKLNQLNKKETEKIYREVIIPEVITVQELASRMAEKSSDVIRELMKLGVMATINQAIDADTAEIVTEALGHKAKRVQDSDVESIIQNVQDNPEMMLPRPPVVTVMGHVDHGKTSLLDSLKSTDIASQEAGGITQHIGAYQVKVDDNHYVTFLDTPGHEAFSAIRSRGAKVTDIVVLVVAADDGVMAQTVEAINHAKAANVPIILAINKIDKPEADPYRVKNELLQHELVVEELGGDVISVEVSAKQKLNLDKLIESILLQAEIMELKADPTCAAAGTVIESKIDKGRGVVATFLVQKGTLKIGDIIVAGATSGKVRSLINDKGQTLSEAGPSMPVEVIGLDEAPIAGDQFNVVPSDKQAREIAEYRQRKLRELKNSLLNRTINLHEAFSRSALEGKIKELPLIIKGDVHGSVEAITASLNKLSNEEVKVKILHSAVGGITESDVTLAKATSAIILGFNVRASSTARQIADADGIDIRYYSIIYNLIDDMKNAVSGMLSPVLREEYIGNAEIRKVFNVSKFGKIAGCYVTKGLIKRGAGVRLIRNNIVIHEGKLKTLRRFQDDVKEVKEGFECGVAFENYEDIKENDILEAFEIIEERKTI